MRTVLRTSRAIAADDGKTPDVFAALRRLAPALADRLDDAHAQLADASRELDRVESRVRRLNPPAVYRDHVPGQRRADFDEVDDIERRVRLADLESGRIDASRKVSHARTAVMLLRREATNLLLHRGASEWSDRSIAFVAARQTAEEALAVFLRASINMGHALAAESRAARAANAIASHALADDDARQALTFAAHMGEVAVGVDEDGQARTVSRPERGLYGADEPDMESVGRTLAFALIDPKRATTQLANSQLGRAAGLNTTR